MAIGPILQEARLKKQLTTSQVAELTRMKIQIVDDLEHDDFHRIAATIYGKGFIKLFAECVDLDPAPLIADYLRALKGGGNDTVSLVPVAEVSSETAAPNEQSEDGDAATAVFEEPEDLFAFARSRRKSSEKQGSAPSGTGPSSAGKSTYRSVKTPFLVLVGKGLSAVGERGALLLNAIKDRLADVKWNDRPLKILVGVVVVFLVLLLLVSVLRSCADRPSSRSPMDHELILFSSPPEPYFD